MIVLPCWAMLALCGTAAVVQVPVSVPPGKVTRTVLRSMGDAQSGGTAYQSNSS